MKPRTWREDEGEGNGVLYRVILSRHQIREILSLNNSVSLQATLMEAERVEDKD